MNNHKPPFVGFDCWRPHQLETVSKCILTDKKVTIVNAPTGTGKTVIGMSIGSEFKRALYLCSSKQLQDQIQRDFPEVPLLKGRNNYVCHWDNVTEMNFPKMSCEDCPAEWRGDDKLLKECKNQCEYESAKRSALANPIAVLNMTYFLTEANYVGTFSGRQMVVVDECDKLEEEVMRFVSVSVSDKVLERVGIKPPEMKTKLEAWQQWAVNHIGKVQREISYLKSKGSNGVLRPDEAKLLRTLISLERKMKLFPTLVTDEWIYQETERGIEFKPIWIDTHMENNFWQHGEKFVLMSATTPLPALLGIEDCQKIDIPSQFPVENRLTYYRPVARLTYKTKADEMPKLIPIIEEIMERHKDEKGLIHTVSYAMAKYLKENIWSDRFILQNSSLEKKDILDRLKSDKLPWVILSPSMDRGVDLPDDLCRFIVIAKIPYPDLSDKQISARVYSEGYFGQEWYRATAAATIVQMTGRGVRSATDHATAYILDSNFENLYAKASKFFPNWWSESIRIWPTTGGEW